jgi:hypothetical protein
MNYVYVIDIFLFNLVPCGNLKVFHLPLWGLSLTKGTEEINTGLNMSQ